MADMELTFELVHTLGWAASSTWAGGEAADGDLSVSGECDLRGRSFGIASSLGRLGVGLSGATGAGDFTTGSERGGETPLDPGGSPRFLLTPYWLA